MSNDIPQWARDAYHEETGRHMIGLGQVVATIGVATWIEEAHTEERTAFMMHCIDRHQRGDWGDVCAEDAAANDRDAAATGEDAGRVLSAYELRGVKVYVITEWDRSVTTVLFPSEY